MTLIPIVSAREGLARPGEDFSQSGLAFIHDLLLSSSQSPLNLESLLAKLAKAFRASNAGMANLIAGKVAAQIEISADGQALPGLSWAPEKWVDLAARLRGSSSIVVPSPNNRSFLVASCSPQESATWLLWLEDEAQRTWQQGEQSTLSLAALALVRHVIDRAKDQRWDSWLDKARQQQSLENIAKVVGRLVHDFNNVLTGILGFTELCLGQLPPGSLPHQFATEVYQAAQKGNKFTAQLGHFSQRNAIKVQPAYLANVVKEELARMQKAWGQAIGIRIEVPEELPAVAVEDGAIRLILSQLLDNAREAIHCTGTVTILARQVELTRTECHELYGNPAPGICVELTVADTGSGFSAEARQRVFQEPFFSSKPRRRGLGLAAVYGILCAHGGGLRLQHGDPSGTVIYTYLPVARQKTPTQPIRRPNLANAKGDKVLVVDDDPLTLRLMCTTLERAGYHVQPAVDGVQAFDCYCKAAEPFRLVLSDVVMPRMTGFDLAQRLLDRDPQVNVLFTSGHIPAGFIPESFVGRNFDLLPKPFRPDGLLRAVRNAMEKETQSCVSSTQEITP